VQVPCGSIKKGYVAGWRIRLLSACRKSWYMAYEPIKDGTIVEKTDIETFVITEGNRAQTAL
jgi:hypothetical protein